MRTLIDGYNLMYALGLLGKRLGPEGFRKVRHRFLSDLANRLGPVEAHLTTVVFDAAAAPADSSPRASHKGLSVIFAVGEESADDRIAQLIAKHSSPKSLTVVSSDNGVRQAATRRRAKVLTSDAFWSQLEERGKPRPEQPAATGDPEGSRRDAPLSPEESSYWQNEFAALDEEPALRKELARDPSLLTDAEIAAIEREVAQEREPEKKRVPGSKRLDR
jgi:predicted RNA-binding protein with PIN domain